jgi:UDP-glucose 4-epimerase
MRRILVTGANGFIGEHLLRALSKCPRTSDGPLMVVAIDRSRNAYSWDIKTEETATSFLPFVQRIHCHLDSEHSVANLMLRYKPNVVFHLAGISVIRENRDPTLITRSNTMSTHHLLAYAPQGCRFVLASSAAVYGNYASDAGEGQALTPNSLYGASKVGAEALVNAYSELGRVRGLSLRLVANVGSGATHGVVKDLLAKLRSDSPTLDLLGDQPGSTKHYTHVTDTASAFVRFGLDTEEGPRVLNVSSRMVLNIEELASLVMETSGIRKPIRWLGEAANWRGDNRWVMVDNSLALSLGWEPKYKTANEAVRQGVLDMVAWPQGF